MSEQQVPAPTVRIDFPSGSLPPALASNHFWIFYLGAEVEIVFGFADIATAIQLRDDAISHGRSEFGVTPQAISRIVISSQSFNFFLGQVLSIAKQMGIDLQSLPTG